MGSWKGYIIIWFAALVSTGVMAQETATVTGQVTDEDGLPIELVNIAVVGYAAGTSSDENGSYSLQRT